MTKKKKYSVSDLFIGLVLGAGFILILVMIAVALLPTSDIESSTLINRSWGNK